MIDFYLNISLHSYYGSSWQLEAEGDTLYWIKSINGNVIEEKRLELSAEMIEAFIKECDDSRVFSWEPHYLQCCMLDGTTWSVLLRYNGFTFRSSGTNGYPDNWVEFCGFMAKLAELDKNPETMVSQVDNLREPW
jgi:hypothetical protein